MIPIHSWIDEVKEMQSWAEEEIKNEPMLFNCDMNHAQELGGRITKHFLKGW